MRIRDFLFLPPELNVRVGETVVWINEDAAVHTVTADDGTFDSGIFLEGQTFSFRAERAGAFPYICEVHPFMEGTLRVTP